jgi:hypothetical protein
VAYAGPVIPGGSTTGMRTTTRNADEGEGDGEKAIAGGREGLGLAATTCRDLCSSSNLLLTGVTPFRTSMMILSRATL